MNRFSCLSLGLGTLLFQGCNNPVSVDMTSAIPSRDAQTGKDLTNAYSFQSGERLYTGNPLDVAIAGDGLFILKNAGQYVYFRRPAHFALNADGHLTLGNENTVLQGYPLWSPNQASETLASSMVNLSRSMEASANWKPLRDAGLEDIVLPFHQMMPARATTSIQLHLKLPADGIAKGTISYSQRFLHSARNNDWAIALSDSRGTELGMRDGDVLTFSKALGGSTEEASYTIQPATTLLGIANALQAFLKDDGATVEVVNMAQSSTLRGALTIYGNQREILNLQVTSDRPISSPKITKAFAVPSLIPKGSASLEVTTDTFRGPAQASDPLVELFDSKGGNLGLEDGDVISITGTIGGTPANNVTPMTMQTSPTPTTLMNVLDRIRENFKLSYYDGTPANNLCVTVNGPATDDNIPDGAIVVRGLPGEENALSGMVITATNQHNNVPSPNNFNANFNMTTQREAVDPVQPQVTVKVFDHLGFSHDWNFQFTPTARLGEWLWEVACDESEEKGWGKMGMVTFGEDGTVSAWTSNDTQKIIHFTPATGANPMAVNLFLGGPGDLSGLTLFAGEFLPQSLVQDGYPIGYRNEITINPFGRIQGHFSNGEVRDMYQIPLADFPNKQGLNPIGPHSFVESKYSGAPLVSISSGNGAGYFWPQYIEEIPSAVHSTGQP